MDTPIALSLIITFGIIVIVGIDSVKSFLLKKEQIKADALVRVEEVKAKNQLELEKLMSREPVRKDALSSSPDSTDDRRVREKA